MSHSAISPVLLSRMRYFRFCASLRPSTWQTCALSQPSFRRALYRVCPARITPASSTTMGAQYPHCRMLSATASTASSFRLGFRS